MSTDLENFLGNDLFGQGPGKRFLNPSYRVGLNFYPLDFSPEATLSPENRWNFLKSRPTDKARAIDWNPLKMSGGGSDASVVRFSWDKQLGQPSAQWMATIKETPGGIDWHAQEIIDGDWVDLAVLRNGILIPLGRGVVDSVREVTRSAGGATVRLWNVSGRDHGAFFEIPITWTSFYAQTINEISGGLIGREVNFEQGGRPDKLFSALIKAAMGPGKHGGMWDLPASLAEKFPGKKRLFDLMRVIPLAASKANPAAGLRGVSYRGPQLWSEGGQSLHQSLTLWSNSIMNEVYYDLLPTPTFLPQNGLSAFFVDQHEAVSSVPTEKQGGGAGPVRRLAPKDPRSSSLVPLNAFGDIAAYIRERPWPNTIEGSASLWFALPTWTVPSWLIESADLGYGGHERFNLFELYVEGGLAGSNQELPIAKPMWSKDSVTKWGLRAFQQTTSFWASSASIFYEERKKWLRLLVDWYAAAPYLRQGTITFRVGLPEIRIGQRLIIDSGLGADQQEQFYVEGVRHNWAWPPGSMSTTVIVTHGFRGTDQAYLGRVRALSALFDDVVEAA